ncbi:bacteriophage lambda tail assembly protein I [uncultured phage MedDCM-OCT-S09-C399]|nr:bacteriophage lambda tail assembly protein I [uncultured phage MedDCM-OCT-S09-C399]
MKVVKVYGALRELLGKTRFEFVADTPAQAMRALLVNFPQLEQWLVDSEKNGVAYRVTVGKQKINEQDVSGMFLPWSEQDVFSIAPVMTGAGRGVGMFVLGAVLVGTAIFTGGASLAFGAGGFGLASGVTATTALGLSIAAGNIGVALVLGGVAQMLSPVPRPPGPAEAPTQLESNSFSGVLNTVRQGVPVPIAYGRVFVGSAVVSAGLDVDQV